MPCSVADLFIPFTFTLALFPSSPFAYVSCSPIVSSATFAAATSAAFIERPSPRHFPRPNSLPRERCDDAAVRAFPRPCILARDDVQPAIFPAASFCNPLCCRHRIRLLQLFAKGAMDKLCGRLKSAIQKNRTRNRFQASASKASLLRPPLFSSPRPKRRKSPRLSRRRPCQRRRAYETVLHTGEFTLGPFRISAAEIVGDDQAEHGVTEKLQRFVVKLRAVPHCPERPVRGPRSDE